MTRFGRSSPRSARSASSVSEAEQILARQAAQRKQSVYKGPMRKGSALEAALAKKFKESRAMEGDAELLKEKAIHDGECVNRLAFYNLVGNVYTAMRDNTKDGAGGNINGLSVDVPTGVVATAGGGGAPPTHPRLALDERVALLTSAGIARVICEIVHSIPTKETEDVDFHEVKKMKLEDIYAYMVKHHSDVILTDLDEADEPDALSARRAIRKFAVDAAGNAIGSTADVLDSVGAAGMQSLIGKLVKVAPENVGKRFQVATITLGDGKGTGELWTTAIAAVSDFVQPTMGGKSSIVITTDVAGLTKDQAAKAATILLTPIVFHMISYIYVSVIDSMLATYKKTGNPAAFDASGNVFHYNLAYPSIVAVMDMYEVNEEDFDHYVAKMIDSIPAVSKVFKAAKKAYDATATPRGRVYRGKADDTPAYFQTEEEKRRAAEEFESMKYENKKASKPVDTRDFSGANNTAENIAKLAAESRLARAELLGTPVAFGRRHKKRGSKKRASAFGKRKSRKARRGSKKRAASFGKRKARRGSKKNSFGKKRRSAGRR